VAAVKEHGTVSARSLFPIWLPLALALVATIPIGPALGLPQSAEGSATACPAEPNGAGTAGLAVAQFELVRGDDVSLDVPAFSPCIAASGAELSPAAGAAGLAATLPSGATAKTLDPGNFVDGDGDADAVFVVGGALAGELASAGAAEPSSEQTMEDQLAFYGLVLNVGAISLVAICLLGLFVAWRRGVEMAAREGPPPSPPKKF